VNLENPDLDVEKAREIRKEYVKRMNGRLKEVSALQKKTKAKDAKAQVPPEDAPH
jgi:hypothetical protein